MRKTILFLTVVSLIIGGALFLAGCTCGAPAAPAATTPATPAAPTPAPTTPSGETAEAILARAAGITSLKYDLVMTAPGQPTMTMKVWVKGQNTRMEATQQGQAIVLITNMDKEVAYQYLPAQNTAIATKIPKGGAQPVMSLIMASPMQFAGILAGTKPAGAGTETIDGKECLVIESTFGPQTAGAQTAKVWVWKQYGFPVRMEIPDPKGTMILEYKNIDFANIADSMFELPAGVKIQQQ